MIDTDSNQYPWTSIFLAGKLTLTPYTLNMTIKFDHPVNVFVLQIGGWTPLAFVLPRR